MAKPFVKPPTYYVFVTVTPTKRNGLREPFTSRVGATNDKPEIKKLIADDLHAMRNTFGGLIEPGGTTGRTYRVFQAEWTEITT